MGCKDKLRNTCGKKINARCVDYEGELHNDSELDVCDDPNVEEVIEDINTTLNKITDSIDLSGLGEDCLTYNKVDGVITVKEALGKIEAKLCEVAELVGLETPDCPTIFSEDIACLNLDFQCLTDACGERITNLKDLLQAIIDQACSAISPAQKINISGLQSDIIALQAEIDALEAAAAVPPPTYDLGDAEDFVVLAGDDLVDTAPQFFTTGDVGYITTELGVQTFGTGSLITGAVAASAVADAASLKAELIGLTGTDITATAAALETTNIGFGAGVFTPGVYTTASAIGVTATGTITLSGDGDYVFVSTGGDLTFGANSTIVLANGAKASKIFWVAQTDLSSTGANSILKGNFLTRDIIIASTNNLEGRFLASRDVTIDGTATDIFLPLA